MLLPECSICSGRQTCLWRQPRFWQQAAHCVQLIKTTGETLLIYRISFFGEVQEQKSQRWLLQSRTGSGWMLLLPWTNGLSRLSGWELTQLSPDFGPGRTLSPWLLLLVVSKCLFQSRQSIVSSFSSLFFPIFWKCCAGVRPLFRQVAFFDKIRRQQLPIWWKC